MRGKLFLLLLVLLLATAVFAKTKIENYSAEEDEDIVADFEDEDVLAQPLDNMDTLAFRGSSGGSRSSGGFRSSSSSRSSSSGSRSSPSTSRSSSSGFRSSSSAYRSSSGIRSSRSGSSSRSSYRSTNGYRGSSFRSSSSYSTVRRSRTTIMYKPKRITYSTFRVKYSSSIFRYNRPYVYQYNSHSYNTFSNYVYKGTYTEAVILQLIGTNPYRKTTMRIRYASGGIFNYYWRNVIIDMVNGWYYVIDPTSTTGTTPISTPMTYVNGTAIAAPGAVVQAADQTTTGTVTITAAPAGAVPSTSDEDSQNAFRMQDAAAQDTIALEYEPADSAIRSGLAILSVFVSMALFALML